MADREEHEAKAFAESTSGGDAAIPRLASRTVGRRAPAASAQLGLSSGQHLPRDIRAFFEPRLGRDLADVRVHIDARAAESALSLRARAYASGSDIVFASGQYRPQTQEGRKLIAHELAHVRQADRGGARIRRDGSGGTAEDLAQQDAKLLEDVKNFPGDFILNSAALRGGLASWKTKYPLSFAELQTKVINVIGEAAFERLLQQDGDILELVQKSRRIVDQLTTLRIEAEGKPAAQNVIDFYAGYIGQQGFYEVDYSYFAVLFKNDPKRDITPFKWLLSGSTEEIVAGVRENASLAQADEDALQAQRETWKADGESVLGTLVAEKQRTLWWNAKLHLQSLLPPEYGDEDPDVMLAVARISGGTTAVVRVKERYHAYTLDKDYSREDIYLLPDKDTYVEVIPAGPLAGDVYALTVSGGFVLRPPVNGDLYRAGDETENPLKRLEADTKLLEGGKAKEAGFQPIDVFQSMLSNLALLNLKHAEDRLKDIRRSSEDEGVFRPTPNPAAGDKLKRDVARLQSVMIELNALAAEIEGKEATDDQKDRRDALLTEAGQIVRNNPGAALFVRNKRDPDSKEPAESSDVENMLGDKSGAEAAQAAMSEVDKRLDNIAQVRRAIFDDPSRVLDFDVLYAPVLARFNDDDKSSIKTALFFHGLDKFASLFKIDPITLVLILGGLITGGETWLGLAFHGAGLGYGLLQLREQVAEFSLVSAESELDVEGGFQLATRDQVSSARNWLLFSIGLNALAAFGFNRAVRTFLEESSRSATLLSRFAARLGVADEVMEAALRKNWLGAADPDPAALQKILLSSLDPELAKQFENRTIVKVLSDAEWLKKYPNSAAHAKLQVLSRGPNPDLLVEFRKSGSILSLEEEAQHIGQATDPKWAGKIMASQDAAKGWATLSDTAKLQAWRDTLEVEIDVQRRLLDRAQLVGDTEAADDAFEQINDLSSRLGEVNDGLADPAKAPRWFDPAHPPGVFSTPRLPRSYGQWGADGKGRPGNSIWYPDANDPNNRDLVRVIGKGNGVQFRNGYPDFSPWSVGRVNLGDMSGEASDFSEADKLFAKGVMEGTRKPPPGFTREDFIFRGEPKAAGTKAYRQSAGLTWHHHQGGKLMLLVPTDLHANVPHTGGASAARAAQ